MVPELSQRWIPILITQLYLDISLSLYRYMCTNTHTHPYMHMSLYSVYIYMYVYLILNLYLYSGLYLCSRMYIYIYTYTSVYTCKVCHQPVAASDTWTAQHSAPHSAKLLDALSKSTVHVVHRMWGLKRPPFDMFCYHNWRFHPPKIGLIARQTQVYYSCYG